MTRCERSPCWIRLHEATLIAAQVDRFDADARQLVTEDSLRLLSRPLSLAVFAELCGSAYDTSALFKPARWLHRRTSWLHGRTMWSAAQEALMRFVRNFGLHQPDRTPCGQSLPVSEAHAMVEIARDGPIRQVELARRLRLEKSTVSRLVTNLAGRGWVRREAADGDGRGVLLVLTWPYAS